MRQGAILLFFIVAIAGIAFPAKGVWEAAAYNIGISSSLLGNNSCGFEAREPSLGDPFSVAGMRAVALVPQVDNITSDLSSPSLVWSWAAEAPATVTFPLSGTTECPGGELELFNRSKITLADARLEYTYGGERRQLALGAGGPNPVALELNSSGLDGSDLRELYANLSVELYAKASASYSFRKRELFRKCEYYENATVCYCAEKSTFGREDYGKALSDGRSFLVEVGPVQEFWLNPPLQQRLDGDAAGKALFFARRMPGKITAAVGGTGIASVAPYSFEALNGSCGERLVKSRYEPRGVNAIINKSSETLAPRQLVEKNASYLPFYLEFGWRESAGRRKVELEYEDWFSNKMNFTREFSVRKPEPFVSNSTEGALAIRAGDDKTSPAAYPSPEKIGAAPNLASLAALLAVPFAIGAAGLLRLAIAWWHK